MRRDQSCPVGPQPHPSYGHHTHSSVADAAGTPEPPIGDTPAKYYAHYVAWGVRHGAVELWVGSEGESRWRSLDNTRGDPAEQRCTARAHPHTHTHAPPASHVHRAGYAKQNLRGSQRRPSSLCLGSSNGTPPGARLQRQAVSLPSAARARGTLQVTVGPSQLYPPTLGFLYAQSTSQIKGTWCTGGVAGVCARVLTVPTMSACRPSEPLSLGAIHQRRRQRKIRSAKKRRDESRRAVRVFEDKGQLPAETDTPLRRPCSATARPNPFAQSHKYAFGRASGNHVKDVAAAWGATAAARRASVSSAASGASGQSASSAPAHMHSIAEAVAGTAPQRPASAATRTARAAITSQMRAPAGMRLHPIPPRLFVCTSASPSTKRKAGRLDSPRQKSMRTGECGERLLSSCEAGAQDVEDCDDDESMGFASSSDDSPTAAALDAMLAAEIPRSARRSSTGSDSVSVKSGTARRSAEAANLRAIYLRKCAEAGVDGRMMSATCVQDGEIMNFRCVSWEVWACHGRGSGLTPNWKRTLTATADWETL